MFDVRQHSDQENCGQRSLSRYGLRAEGRADIHRPSDEGGREAYMTTHILKMGIGEMVISNLVGLGNYLSNI